MEMYFIEAEISGNKNTKVKSKCSWIKHFYSCCCVECDFFFIFVQFAILVWIIQIIIMIEKSKRYNVQLK